MGRYWMNFRQNRLKTVSSVVMLIFTGLVWVIFAPIQFGGQAAYVIISGNSMEPLYHRGDLVILYGASDYQIGDIATYHHPEIGPIIHRIIAIEGDHFVFQGDNNNWIDTYQPSQDELVGKPWVHLPTMGKTLEKLRTPQIISPLAAAIVFILLTTSTRKQNKHKKFRHDQKTAKEQVSSMENRTNHKADIFVGLAMLVLGSFLLALFAFNQPVTTTKSENINYTQQGIFSYSAAAPPGLYTSDVVQVGEPIFRQLINKVAINFDYRLDSDLPPKMVGSYQLDLIIGHSSGWNWTIEFQPETSFEGNSFSVSGLIDLSQIQSVIDNLEQQTGLQNQQYTLTVLPKVFINGILAGQGLNDEFSPPLTFQLSQLQMQVVPNRNQADPFVVSQTGLVKQAYEAPNMLSMMKYQFSVSTVRFLAMISLMLFSGGALVMGILILKDTQGGEISRIQAKYGALLTIVHNTNLTTGHNVVEVTTIDDLAKIAERYGRMILHQIQGSIHHYYVQDNGTIYHYQLITEAKKLKRSGHGVMKVRPL